jgi:hypothetical protein
MKIKRIEPIAVSLPMVKPLKMSFEEVASAENVLGRRRRGAHHDRRDGGEHGGGHPLSRAQN